MSQAPNRKPLPMLECNLKNEKQIEIHIPKRNYFLVMGSQLDVFLMKVVNNNGGELI